MLSIVPLKDPGAVVTYFEKDNYYAKDDPMSKDNSQWYGKGAEQLELSGSIDKDQFTSLLEGHVNDKRLGKNIDGKWQHTPGWDLTFSAPKSYSILNQLVDDKRLYDAHDRAVKEALSFLQDTASYVRITKDGKTRKLLQKNLTVAMFRHDTSRALDPNDHTHCVVANAVETESGWRSLDSKKFFDMKLKTGEIYRRQLARGLINIGHEIEVTQEKYFFFEIKGVPKDLIDHHSKRRKQILNQLDELELDSAKAAAVAAKDTRSKKTDVDRNALRKEWQSAAKDHQFNPKSVIAAAKKNKRRLDIKNKGLNPTEKTLELVDHCIAVLSEREASFPREKLVEECVANPIYHPSYEEITQALETRVASGDLISIGDARYDLYTTKAGQALEKSTVDQLYQGFEKFDPIRENVDLKALFPEIEFSQGQADALKLILETKDQFVGVQGYAGTGKTFMLKSATAIAEMAGYEVKGMAPSSSAAQVLGDEIDRPTENLAKHMANHYRKQNQNPDVEIDNSKQLWFMDESSLASTKDLKNLMNIAMETDARVVFIGDTAQKDSVEAGRAFYQLQAAGMETAIMADIKRQKDLDLRKAVYSLVSLIGVNELKDIDQTIDHNVYAARNDFRQFCETVKPLVPDKIHKELLDISNKLDLAQNQKERNQCLKSALSVISDDVSKALNNLEGRIVEYEGANVREEAFVEDFINLSKEDRANTILVVPSNQGREDANQRLRAQFAAEGSLNGYEVKIKALVNRGLEAERLKYTYAYHRGNIVRFGRNFRKNKEVVFKTGDYARVVGKTGDGALELKKIEYGVDAKSQEPIIWKPQKTMRDGSVELYEQVDRGLRIGERIRWRKNIAKQGIINGEESTITAMDGHTITTVNEKGVEKKYDLKQISSRHIDYAYTHTVDTAQGATFTRVMGICESFRKNLINQKSLYVVISRAKEHARLYTDNADSLFKAIFKRHGANTVSIDAKAYAEAIKLNNEKYGVTLRTDTGQEHSFVVSGSHKSAEEKGHIHAAHIGLQRGNYRMDVTPVETGREVDLPKKEKTKDLNQGKSFLGLGLYL